MDWQGEGEAALRVVRWISDELSAARASALGRK